MTTNTEINLDDVTINGTEPLLPDTASREKEHSRQRPITAIVNGYAWGATCCRIGDKQIKISNIGRIINGVHQSEDIDGPMYDDINMELILIWDFKPISGTFGEIEGFLALGLEAIKTLGVYHPER